jgi:hypothetical protein
MPKQEYIPDRWRDQSIQAQVAVKGAVDLLKEREIVTPELFEEWATTIYNTITKLAGEPPARLPTPETAPSAEGPTDRPSKSYGDTSVKFGKFAGMTFDQIWTTVADDGQSGAQWVRWCAENSTNNFLKATANGFLRHKGQQT